MRFTSTLILAVALLALAVPAKAQTSLNNGYLYGVATLTNGNASISIPVRNRSGGALGEGSVVIWKVDTTQIVTQFGRAAVGHGQAGVGDSSWSIDKAHVATDSGLGSLAGVYQLTVEMCGTAVTDTLFIMGKGTANTNEYTGNVSYYTSIKDTIIGVGGADSAYASAKHWTRIDSFRLKRGASGLDSLYVRASEWNAITTVAGAADAHVAGVMFDSTASNGTGRMIIFGYARAFLLPSQTQCFQGEYIETSGTAKYGQVNATPAAGKGFGKCLEVVRAHKKNYRYRVFVNTSY